MPEVGAFYSMTKCVNEWDQAVPNPLPYRPTLLSPSCWIVPFSTPSRCSMPS